MKKLSAVLLSAALLCGLCACGIRIPNITAPEAKEPVETAVVIPTPTPSPETTEEPTAETVPEAAQMIVTVQHNDEKYFAPDNGTLLLLSFSYDTVRTYMEENPGASENINACLSLQEEQFYTGNDYGDGSSDGLNGYLEQALDNYAYRMQSGTSGSVNFSVSRTAAVEYFGDSIFSLRYTDTGYLGGAHGSHSDKALCFDRDSGAHLSFWQLAADPVPFTDRVREYIVQELSQQAELCREIEPMMTLAEAASEMMVDGCWYLNAEGLVCFANPGEIAPYATGIVKVTVPYASLSGLFERFFPTERPGEAEWSVDTETASSMILDRIVQNENGSTLMLTCMGTAHNVKIGSVAYFDADGKSNFYETGELWACSYVTDCALQLQIVVPDGIPDTMLSFTDECGEHRLLISQTGYDGSFRLVSDDIVTLG